MTRRVSGRTLSLQAFAGFLVVVSFLVLIDWPNHVPLGFCGPCPTGASRPKAVGGAVLAFRLLPYTVERAVGRRRPGRSGA